MKNFIADVHLHSKYSRAVSSHMTIPTMSLWAKKKGIQLLGTGDWTHPFWFSELQKDLKETGTGLYERDGIFYILSCEISLIYSQEGKTRRIHLLVFAPSLSVVEKINAKLSKRGNLLSDGRPILGLTAKELAELVFSISPDCFLLPAHIWTPWFSLYGSKSGFDSLEECFGEYATKITAVETGLSSNPSMNWRIKELDTRGIVSFSDAHSPEKLGREACVLSCALTYKDILSAFSTPNKDTGLVGTIEFYPEEGKYHFTGHRKCGVKHSPDETRRLGTTCPVCGAPLTVGVMHRVEELASRDEHYVDQKRPPYQMTVPLVEILAEAVGTQTQSQKVKEHYEGLVKRFGNEFAVLRDVSIQDLAKSSSERIADGIKRVREGRIVVDPGFDGEFGKVKIWGEGERSSGNAQMTLFEEK
ncbi:MAG TPA: endonuclease Q family protein [Patescibacteria group bacterium]|nr:endonuclease Q family protein [Patescibacteria group bacterium]